MTGHTRLLRNAAHAKKVGGHAPLRNQKKHPDQRNISLKKRNVTHVAKNGKDVAGHTRLLRNVAHARKVVGHAPLRNQKKGCQCTRNAKPVLRTEENVSANLPSKVNVLFARQIIENVMHKAWKCPNRFQTRKSASAVNTVDGRVMAKNHAQHARDAIRLAVTWTVTQNGHIRQTQKKRKHQNLLIARDATNTICLILVSMQTVMGNSRAKIVAKKKSRPEVQAAHTTTRVASQNTGD